MVWFKVDDGLHKHRKARKVLAEAPAALGLWVAAGSWSSDELTDGFIPEEQLPWLIPADGETLAQTLVTARLWKRVKGGYQFHQWAEDGDGTKRNPTRKEVEEERRKKAEAGRKGGLARGKKRSKPEAGAKAGAKQVLDDSLNPRPDPPPSTKEDRGDARPRSALGAAGAPLARDSPPEGEDPVSLRSQMRAQIGDAKRKHRASANSAGAFQRLVEADATPDPA